MSWLTSISAGSKGREMSDSAELAVLVLQEVTKLLQGLSPERISRLVAGDARIAYLSDDEIVLASKQRGRAAPTATKKATTRPSVADVVDFLRRVADPREREEYLYDSPRVEELKLVASQYN